MNVIERRMELDASPERVWRALTDPTEVAGWFGDGAEFALEVGSVGWFHWEKHGRHSMRVEELDPPRRFAWRWSKDTDTPIDEGVSTLVEWTLTPRDGGGTILELRESGFEQEEHFASNTGGWKKELGELESFLAGEE